MLGEDPIQCCPGPALNVWVFFTSREWGRVRKLWDPQFAHLASRVLLREIVTTRSNRLDRVQRQVVRAQVDPLRYPAVGMVDLVVKEDLLRYQEC